MVYEFTQNSVISFFYQELITLLSVGTYTADVFTDPKQTVKVDYTNTHGSVVLMMFMEAPFIPDTCGRGVLPGTKDLSFTIYVMAKSRSVAYALWSIIEDFLKAGQFQTTMDLPVGVPSELMYAEIGVVRTIPSESELFGLQASLDVYFFRV